MPTGPVAQGRLGRTFTALTNGDFRLLWFGMIFSMAAMQVNLVSRSWLAYDLSGSGAILGLVALARGFPQFVLAPVGGVAADRFDKRTLLILSQSGLAVLGLVNALLVQTGVIQVWHLVVIGAVQGCLFPFSMPTRTAYISDLVDDDRLSNALALDATGRNLNRVLAPTLAGLLIAWSPTVAFYSIAVFFTLTTVMLLRLPRPGRPDATNTGALADIVGGFRYMRQHSTLVALTGMAFVLVMLGMPFQQLLPVFQVRVFDVGPQALGMMYTAVGVGAIVGSLAAAYLSESERKPQIQVGAGIIFGVALALFALSPSFVVALAFLVLVGCASQGYFTINRILVMLATDREYYGRVMSVYMMNWSLMPLALLPMGAIVDQVGAPDTIAAAGLLLTVFVVAIALVRPGIRHMAQSTSTCG